MALLSTAGMVPLYSGVTARTRSAAATWSRSAAAAAGTSCRRRGPRCRTGSSARPSAISTVTPAGAWPRRCSAMRRFSESARRLPTRTSDAGVRHGVLLEGRGDGHRSNGPRSGSIPDRADHSRDPVAPAPRVSDVMPEPRLLPARSTRPHPERRDAARNREALLAGRPAAGRATAGSTASPWTRVAAEAGVGKGTVFRRFESREGLMARAARPLRDRVAGRGDLRSRRRWARAPSRGTGCWPSAAPGSRPRSCTPT